MKESSPRFLAPTSTPRPRGSRLLTAFSPKLGRTVRAFDHFGFDQWIRLEADPGVTAFCEHPRRVGSGDDGPLIDFWLTGRSNEEMLVLDRGQDAAALPSSVQDIPLRFVPAAEQAAAAVWISNWQRLIPVINATRGITPKTLVKSVLSLVRKPLALSFIEHELSVGDPAIVRGAIFELLRTGQLVAPSLHTQPLSLHTAVEPAP
ncbi:MAG: hypothetical protein JF606_22650 [Burkholderiales bacterium]|nr:hypothetical protein [Burkholderiales bacterium]